MEEEYVMPVWKSYLYHLQQQAPKPRRIVCRRDIPNRPPQYGKEFHGDVSREETDKLLLLEGDGCYLVRESQRAPGTYTLAIRFDNVTKNFKLFYDAQHYVGEKKFDTIHDLVEDGLITFYLESRAADYISKLDNESIYEESPYYRQKSKKQRELTLQRQEESLRNGHTGSRNDAVDSNKVDVSSFEKPHKFKIHTFKGPHWCEFCANFMWGLIAQGVKCQDCGFNAHKKCSEKVPKDCLPEMKYLKRVFGTDLTTLVKAQNSAIPCVVDMCVKELEKRGIDQEGLYRVAGFHDDVETIKMTFDKDGDSTDISHNRYEDINTISSVVKAYFRELPIPLITFDTYPKFMETVNIDHMDNDERLQKIYHALTLLPPAHYQTLKFFMAHLGRVTDKQRINMMSPENLAIVFAPTLLRSPDSNPLTTLTAAKYERALVELIVLNQKQLFS